MSMNAEMNTSNLAAVPTLVQTLLLDDSAFDRARIRRMSNKIDLNVNLTEVSGIAELKVAVDVQSFDLILIDYHLPQGNGLEVLSCIQQSGLNRNAGVIMITGEGDTQTAVTAMRIGCHDFLIKDAMTTDHLQTAMVRALQTAQDRRDVLSQTVERNDMIRDGMSAALMEHDIKGTVRQLFKDEFAAHLPAPSRQSWAHDDNLELDALLATMDDDDEFIFN